MQQVKGIILLYTLLLSPYLWAQTYFGPSQSSTHDHELIQKFESVICDLDTKLPLNLYGYATGLYNLQPNATPAKGMWPQNLASIEDGYSSTDLAWFIYNAFIDEGFVATIVRGKDQHNYWGEHVWVEVKVLQQWIQVDFTPYYRRAMPFLHDTSLQHTSITRGLEKTAFSSWKETPFIALPYAPGDNMPLGMIVDIDIPREIEFFLVVESIQNNTVKLIGRVFQNTYATTTFKEQTPLYNVVVEIDLQKMKTWIRAQEDSSCLSQDCTRDMLAQRVDIQEDGTGFFKSHMEISRVYNKELDANDASQLEYLLVRAALAMVLPDLVQTKKE